MKLATVYKRPDACYFHSNRLTTVGVWLAGAPFIKTPRNAEPSSRGEALLKALSASFGIVPHPSTWEDGFPELTEFARVATWEEFTESALCVDVQSSDRILTFVPLKREYDEEKNVHHFTPILEREFSVSDNLSATELANALERAFEMCSCVAQDADLGPTLEL